jgi:hypothetical protein
MGGIIMNSLRTRRHRAGVIAAGSMEKCVELYG